MSPQPKWWGWGAADRRLRLGESARAMLRSELGVDGEPSPPPGLSQMVLPEAAELPRAVIDAAGRDAVATDVEARVRHAVGRSYPDLIRLRSRRLEAAPDAVVAPADAAGVEAVLAACAAEGVAVVPFGGGTSVVGGVEPIRGDHERLIALSLERLRGVEVDRISLTARLGPGLRGPQAEAELRRRGLTLGHFPQSYELATIGGYAATRSVGQASSGYGRFDDMVTAVELTAPAGRLRTLQTPHTAAGPSLRELIVGSEGTLGAITEVTVVVRPAPAARRYEAWIAPDFAAGREAVRALAQRRALADVVRLSDEQETRIALAMSGVAEPARRALDAYLRLRRRAGGCLIVCGFEGDRGAVRRRRKLAAPLLRAAGAVSIGAAPGRAWAKSRYDGPYQRDELISHGVLVDTLETSHTWARLGELYRAVGGAISAALERGGTPGIVICHLSHAYADGASLYFTFLAAARRGEELDQWHEVKAAACEAIVGVGATITHHHGVGRDHAPYMAAEIGELGLDVLGAVKERLDPTAIMNPGKLLGG